MFSAKRKAPSVAQFEASSARSVTALRSPVAALKFSVAARSSW